MADRPPSPGPPAAEPQCPVDPARQRWLESSLSWFADQFGTGPLHRDAILPTAKFLVQDGYCASADQVQALVAHLCQQMMVAHQRIRLELFDGSAEKKQAARTGRSRAVGHFRIEDGQAIVAVDQSESSDRQLLTAIVVHELCHLRLLGEGRIRRDRPDGERLTDLLTVYFGFGIFSANAALRFARADRGWSLVPFGDLDDRTLNAARNDGYHRLGYLTSAEFGYALACYGWLRGERHPAWAPYLSPGARVVLERGLAYLASTSTGGQLPTQRLMNKPVKMGNATIRITRGKTLQLGTLGLTLPDHATPRPSDDATPGDRQV